MRSLVVGLLLLLGGACGGVALTSVAPPTVAAGGVVDVFGSGFSDALQLSLEGDAGTVSLAVAVDGPGAAHGTLPGSTPAGTYDLVAAQDGATAALPGAVQVVAGQLEMFFLDIGQGDATFVLFPDGSTLLFDGGPPDAGGVVQRFLDETVDGRLDHIALSHTDADHLGGIVAVLRERSEAVPTRWIGHDDAVCDSQLCDSFRALPPFEIPALETVVDHGGATMTVVARDGEVAGASSFSGIDEENERSLALLFEFAGRSVFIGGDLTGGGLGTEDLEAAVAARTGPVDVLHLNHHGSQTSSSPGFLDALQPRAVVVSAGTDNAFCHPEEGVVARLGDTPVFATGAGVVDDVDRCGAPTAWSSAARVGLSTFSLVITADGTLTLAGEALP